VRAVDPRSSAASKRRTSSRDDFDPSAAREHAADHGLETIPHTGYLPDWPSTPRFMMPAAHAHETIEGRLSCAYCGVGDSGRIRAKAVSEIDPTQVSATIEVAGAGDLNAGRVGKRAPTLGCSKLNIATGQLGGLFPMHLVPSLKERYGAARKPITYEQAISRFADLILDHREPDTQILVYGCGQIDYFTIFALQEVFRLLGVRNLAGNAEHCLNAGAVHNEMLTGQEGPFLTFDGALEGPGRFYVLNGWNGMITHPGAWNRLIRRKDFDGYVVDVMMSETAAYVGKRLGEDRVLLVRSGSDPHLALSVAHVLLKDHGSSIERRFLDQFADWRSWKDFEALAKEERFAPEQAALQIAPDPSLVPRLVAGIRGIAANFADEDTVPINIPSVGLSQTKGAVSHCLWGDALAMVGKYGLKPDGSPAGGTLRVPGQINAESEIQALSRLFFFGRIPVDDEGAAEAARRMGLPDDSYELAVRDDPRPVLDYSVSDNEFDRELIIAFGTQFEANMMDRERWLKKLTSPDTTLIVVDPIPDPWSLDHAELIVPSPPHAAAPKVYQNGEWRMTASVPRKRAAPQTRSDASIIYDVMAEISKRIRDDSMLRMIHPDLGFHSQTGYLRERFESVERGGGLPRYEGEVDRETLWGRVQDYCADGDGRSGELYCRPVHADGKPIEWEELLRQGHIVYGGCGTNRYVLDYDGDVPFADVFGRPGPFRFFRPSEADLRVVDGIVFNTGRSALIDDPLRFRFAVDSFNSGKATPSEFLPDENPLYIAEGLAAELELERGDAVRVTNPETGQSAVWRAWPTDRLVGRMVYTPFHKDRVQLRLGRYVNAVTSQSERCPYTAQSAFKSTIVRLESAGAEEAP
jgi:anaerobic selenocysteine-containing dehydrogenase